VLAAKANVTDEVFNVASGVETSLNDLARSLLRVMNSDLKPEYGPARKVNPVSRRLADVSRARQKIGFQSQVSLQDGLSRLVNWWQSNRAPAPPSVEMGAKV
jgi:UDP-glucose 4-epimerase